MALYRSTRRRWSLVLVALTLVSLYYFYMSELGKHNIEEAALDLQQKIEEGHELYATQQQADGSALDASRLVDEGRKDSQPAGHVPNPAAQPVADGAFPYPSYVPGTVPMGQNFTRSLVIARTMIEDTAWVARNLFDEPLLSTFIYNVDDLNANPNVPQNKGHEVMVYLTYIIDHYSELADVTMFMHAHELAWHNNDLLDSSAVKMVRHLSSAKVIRDGYFNMRCHLDPGCPAHIHPGEDNIDIPEAKIIGDVWKELFPGQKVPDVLSQPCCAQLAVSRERIQTLPREQYVYFRDWLLASTLEDRITGRIFEYVWQYIWTGEYEFCPDEHVCYCDGYGVCMDGKEEYNSFYELRKEASMLYQDLPALGRIPLADKTEAEYAYEKYVGNRIDEIEKQLIEMKGRAFERGQDPKIRASEAGRSWQEGDGF